MSLFLFAMVILVCLAVFDLVVGVSNDAVNFLNSAVGSRAAPRWVIMAVASLGMLAGVTFSSGMMEVARKGIFHPSLFTMPELMVIFLAVMLTDVILLDLFNTFGLPTSTTVSIVFELLGAALAVSLLKLHRIGASYGEVVNYINSAKALAIISGILISVAVAFLVGAAVQFATRLLFTFDFERRLRRWGALWGGGALALITYFMVVKGAKGASFLSDETVAWIGSHTGTILLYCFLVSAVALEALLLFTKVNILRVIVLVGTFALAMAFAANDLVNFIGVPLAGVAAHAAAFASSSPTTVLMEALQRPVSTNTLYLLTAGVVMVLTLWLSRKARTVTKTEVMLGRQDEGFERFESTALSRVVVRTFSSLLENTSRVFPGIVRRRVAARFERATHRPVPSADGHVPSFDLLRAAVNLMVASALISFATSLKLPLSTTYVTFMVAMGTSLSDQAWGRESAVYRVTGVLTVIGGWFFTAVMALTISSLFATAIFFGKAVAVLGLLALVGLVLFRTHHVHRNRQRAEDAAEVFILRKIEDAEAAMGVAFGQAGVLLREVREVLGDGVEGLSRRDRGLLKRARVGQQRLQVWSNILTANIFKVLRLRQWEEVETTQRYVQTTATLQEISESLRDVVMRSYLHVANNHAGLLPEQVSELEQIRDALVEIISEVSRSLRGAKPPDPSSLAVRNRELRLMIDEFDQHQIERIQRNASKTRLSILFYSVMWDCLKIAENATYLLDVFQEPAQLPSGRERKPHPARVLTPA